MLFLAGVIQFFLCGVLLTKEKVVHTTLCTTYVEKIRSKTPSTSCFVHQVHFLTGNPSTREGLKAESIGSATTTAADINYFKAQFLEAGVETIADPYKGRILTSITDRILQDFRTGRKSYMESIRSIIILLETLAQGKVLVEGPQPQLLWQIYQPRRCFDTW
jgi:hypothetical protein